MKKIFYPILSIILIFTMMITSAVPLNAAVNVEGQGGSSGTVGGGANTYNNADQMWKISLYYGIYDTNDENTSNLCDTGKWKQYGATFYMYHPTAIRGDSGSIKLDYFKNALFVRGNKPSFLAQTTSAYDVSATLSVFGANYFYPNSDSPAIAMNGNSIDAVKTYFNDYNNLIDLADQARIAAGYSDQASAFETRTFRLDGVNGNIINKSANGGVASNGYCWDTGSTHIRHNDWVNGVKYDFLDNQIFIYPTLIDGKARNMTAWVIVYEPVLCVEVGGFNIGNTSFKYVACTPTEFALLHAQGVVTLGTLKRAIFDVFSTSTYLDTGWLGISNKTVAFTKDSDPNIIYQQAGIGLTIFDPFNYVLKDYRISGVANYSNGGFNLTYTCENRVNPNNGNNGAQTYNDTGVLVLANISNPTTGDSFWVNLKALNGQTITRNSAIPNGYDFASAAQAIGGSPNDTPIASASSVTYGPYYYSLSSDLQNGYNIDIRMVINGATADGGNGRAIKEVNSRAYYNITETNPDRYYGDNFYQIIIDRGKGTITAPGTYVEDIKRIYFSLNPIITYPNVFGECWSNPVGAPVYVNLYKSDGTWLAGQTITIGDNINTYCCFEGVYPEGNYFFTATSDCPDITFYTNLNYNEVGNGYGFWVPNGSGEYWIGGYLRNRVHKIRVDYYTDYDNNMVDNYFAINCWTPYSGSNYHYVEIKNATEYILPYGMDGAVNNYHIYQIRSPENYTMNQWQDWSHEWKPTIGSDELFVAPFYSTYIWNFDVDISTSMNFVEPGEAYTCTVTLKNYRPKEASPTIDLYHNNTLIQQFQLYVPAGGTSHQSFNISLPATEEFGEHIYTAYVNYDGRYYEEAMGDNIEQCSIILGGDISSNGIAPDTNYIRGYEAIASCYVSNNTIKDILGKHNLDVIATLTYQTDAGVTKSVSLNKFENIVIANVNYEYNKNIAYFKFTVPSEAKLNSNVTIEFKANSEKSIAELDYNNNISTITNKVVDKTASNPETLGRELKIPSGYYGTTVTPEIESSVGERTWSQWSENSDGTIKIDTYTTNSSIDSVVKIDNRCISAIWQGNNLNMRSGYAFTIRTHPVITVNKNGSAYSEDRMITTFQSARVYYPEFRYSQELGKYTELEVVNSANANTSQFSVYSPYFLDKNTGKSKYTDTQDVGMVSGSVSRYELPINDVTSFQELGRKHFIPIFWKDGEYNLQLYATQLWCPVGVVSTYDYAKTSKGGKLIIEGSVYDDYYTVRG